MHKEIWENMRDNTKMKKVLPMAIPISETYQLPSFMMGIISQNKSVRNTLFNSYINIYISKNDLDKVTLEFVDAECEPYRLSGWGEMDLFYLSNIAKDKCLGFLKERIDQNNYLLLFEIDEYELSYSECYKKEHFKHDTYIYGYDEDYFNVMAYSHGHLQLLKVPEQEIVEGLYSLLDNESHFCSFRVFHKARVPLSIKKILVQIDEYMAGENNAQGETTGISVYSFFQQTLSETVQNRTEGEILNQRVIRMLWEHKKMIVFRTIYLAERIDSISALLPSAKKIEQQGEMVRILIMKYNLTQDYDILNRVKKILNEMECLERDYWSSLREILQKS